MPIQIKDFTWDQTDVFVRITVPLKGVQAAKTNIFSSDLYVKVGLLTNNNILINTATTTTHYYCHYY